MNNAQPGILAEVPSVARYLTFSIDEREAIPEALKTLSALADGEEIVVGLGSSLLSSIGVELEDMRAFPSFESCGIEIPASHGALWCWLRGRDRGTIIHKERELERALFPAFRLENVVDAFKYKDGRDLTGYEDGTENPEGEDASFYGFVNGSGKGMDGSSFVAVQQWIHDLDIFEGMDQEQQDNTIGRRRSDNEELDEAPLSAHVKRTAQEDYEPEAFMVRRSMPWANEGSEGLVFVAFGHSFNAFESILIRMTGQEDGIVDALFQFSQPVTGAYFWCPPMQDGKLDLSLLELDW